ncbi:response regulator transcription factor [Catellatospora coxensis]|uniref:HTH luxR-type domain-containing protein n=1 Tax=Catellatospora coxensis TaxID=310354 RepID=A0A8J3L068_9ACTN|nr:helix-turn-helix transcriptional regulator [Catellatospora coxensis]GIG08789.1 hypothetical protein Cco03nite_54890 [Catellatospora coxensis]
MDANAEIPTGRQIEVIRLLADGSTDETIARRLDVSVRTVRRDIADLTRQLDVQGRMALGVAVERLDWLTTLRKPGDDQPHTGPAAAD